MNGRSMNINRYPDDTAIFCTNEVQQLPLKKTNWSKSETVRPNWLNNLYLYSVGLQKTSSSQMAYLLIPV